MSAPSHTTDPFISATAMRDALRSGDLTAVEAAEQALARIEAAAALGAFVSVTRAQALADAAAADALRMSGAQLPPLHGMPIAHKDIVDVAGAPSSYGSAALPHGVADTDHPVVAALRTAGTVSLGKTQVPELGLNAYSENLVAPPARNPYDLDRTPGGSSGGSAAAVAAGLLPFAPGSDGGGSIRIPALACGLVGLKPGLGTVPGDIASGTVDTFGAPRLTVSGPLARDAADAALLMDAMAGDGGGDQHIRAVHAAETVRGLTVAVSDDSPFSSSAEIALSADAHHAFLLAAERLAALGHHPEETRMPYDPEYPEFFTSGWISGLTLLELSPSAVEQLTPLTAEFRRRALAHSEEEHRASGARLRRFARETRELWGEHDIVLTPGLAFDAPLIGDFTSREPMDDYRHQCEWTPYTSMVNVTGLPAIAVPMLRTSAGLPVGVQLIGREGSEAQLLALAAQLMA